MFDLPDAKRVRREALYESASDGEETAGGQSPQADSALRDKLHTQLSGLLDFSSSAVVRSDDSPQSKDPMAREASGEPAGAVDGGQPEEEFVFRLFRDEEPSHTIVIARDDQALEGDGAFVVPKRPRSYYVADEPPPDLARQFRMAAVSAEYLLQDAKKRRWGLEKPWRVMSLSSGVDRVSKASLSSGVSGDTEEQGAAVKRKRPGKKRRIVLRIREKAREEREEAAKQKSLDKEQHLKDKKKRLNREKKLKRRAKAREQKQATGANMDAASEQSSAESSRGDD
ncbi:hypothetical protein GGR56DRAFT_656224 [Xylariaceae sp. FL0804]|nr:hypothetical protein GGR56DRAFT_656224 [Xylariaceae sp. FL0804]